MLLALTWIGFSLSLNAFPVFFASGAILVCQQPVNIKQFKRKAKDAADIEGFVIEVSRCFTSQS